MNSKTAKRLRRFARRMANKLDLPDVAYCTGHTGGRIDEFWWKPDQAILCPRASYRAYYKAAKKHWGKYARG